MMKRHLLDSWLLWGFALAAVPVPLYLQFMPFPRFESAGKFEAILEAHVATIPGKTLSQYGVPELLGKYGQDPEDGLIESLNRLRPVALRVTIPESSAWMMEEIPGLETQLAEFHREYAELNIGSVYTDVNEGVRGLDDVLHLGRAIRALLVGERILLRNAILHGEREAALGILERAGWLSIPLRESTVMGAKLHSELRREVYHMAEELLAQQLTALELQQLGSILEAFSETDPIISWRIGRNESALSRRERDSFAADQGWLEAGLTRKSNRLYDTRNVEEVLLHGGYSLDSSLGLWLGSWQRRHSIAGYVMWLAEPAARVRIGDAVRQIDGSELSLFPGYTSEFANAIPGELRFDALNVPFYEMQSELVHRDASRTRTMNGLLQLAIEARLVDARSRTGWVQLAEIEEQTRGTLEKYIELSNWRTSINKRVWSGWRYLSYPAETRQFSESLTFMSEYERGLGQWCQTITGISGMFYVHQGRRRADLDWYMPEQDRRVMGDPLKLMFALGDIASETDMANQPMNSHHWRLTGRDLAERLNAATPNAFMSGELVYIGPENSTRSLTLPAAGEVWQEYLTWAIDPRYTLDSITVYLKEPHEMLRVAARVESFYRADTADTFPAVLVRTILAGY